MVIPELGAWRHPDEQYAVLYDDVDGKPRVTGTTAAVRLATHHPGGDAPWACARRRGEPVLVEPADLPFELRARGPMPPASARVGGSRPDPLHERPAVVIGWSRGNGPPASVHRYTLEIMGRMLNLVLQWRRQREELQTRCSPDPLTAVVNRAGFFEVLGEALATASPTRMVGILYVDLDGFKDVNDAHGHSVGDDVLRVVARRLSSAVRGDDLIGRLGGDESRCSARAHRPDDLTAVAARIIEDVSEPIAVRGVELRVGASIGIATAAGATVPDQLVDTADRALTAPRRPGAAAGTSRATASDRTRRGPIDPRQRTDRRGTVPRWPTSPSSTTITSPSSPSTGRHGTS